MTGKRFIGLPFVSMATLECGQHLKDVIDVLFGVVGGDLKADLLISFRHHRIIEAGGQNVMGKEMLDKGGGFRRIPKH